MVLTEIRQNVLIITINRPDKKNAINYEAACQIEAAIDLLDETDQLFLGIVTGIGDTFSAGADLKAIARGERCGTDRRGGFGILGMPSKKPMIAAVEGFALGGGMELCLACDLIVAARNAKFALPEVRHNAVAIGGGLLRLQHRIPYNIAMEMALTGQLRSAESLEKLGLVNRVCEDGAALETALELSSAILANGPTALAASKQILSSSHQWPENELWERQASLAIHATNSADFNEGLAAFAEKRKPIWRGC